MRVHSLEITLVKLYYVILILYKYIYFSESNEISIPKLGNQKFSTLAELLQEQNNYNDSQSSMYICLIINNYIIFAF